METIQIELKNKNALSILRSLERAQMIKLISKDPKTEHTPVRFKGAIPKSKSAALANKMEKSEKEIITKPSVAKKRTFGYAKDAITIKPDFDEPMDDFKEYME